MPETHAVGPDGALPPDKQTTLVQGRSAALSIPPPAIGGEKEALERMAAWMLDNEVCRHPSGQAPLDPYWMALQSVDGYPAFRRKFMKRMQDYARVDPHVSGTIDPVGFARHVWRRMHLRLAAWCDRVNPGRYMTPRDVVQVYEEHFLEGQKRKPLAEQRFTFETPRMGFYAAAGFAGWQSSGEVRSGTMRDVIQDMDISESEKTEKHNQLTERSKNVEKILDARG